MRNLALILLLYSFSIHPDENREQYAGISKLISEERFSEAESRLKNLMEQNGDPVLGQMQTELWMQQGDSEFRKRNFRKALLYYENSASQWLLNPLLQDKIQNTKKELLNSGASLQEYSEDSFRRTDKKGMEGKLLSDHSLNVIVLDEELSSELKRKISGRSGFTVISDKWLILISVLLTVLTAANLTLIAVFFRHRNRE